MVVLFDFENASVYIGHLCPALEGGEPPNYELYDAEEVMLHAWDLVTPMTITRCCRHAGFEHPGGTVSTHQEDEEECLPLVQLADRLQGLADTWCIVRSGYSCHDNAWPVQTQTTMTRFFLSR